MRPPLGQGTSTGPARKKEEVKKAMKAEIKKRESDEGNISTIKKDTGQIKRKEKTKTRLEAETKNLEKRKRIGKIKKNG